ncbi:MAG: hypothetical protein LC667_06935, partial [Thioalkalivibrio sp.]|nr:hypothetical protein [Thioalkalivibrio sp.]
MSGSDTPPQGAAEALERDYARWVGVERTRRELLSVWPARALAATLDQDPARLDEGAALPHGWHWIYFNDAVPA